MSNEIATYSMILSKLSLGKSGTECPTKTQILAINSLIVIDNASTYGANECVKIDDIRKKVETWNYYLTVSPTSMSFGAGGGSKSFTVSSYKRKVLDGVEQSGDTSVSLKSTTISGTGFSLSGTTVSASANESTSSRSGTVTITQNESNKTATISLSQSGDTASSYGEWVITVSANPTSVSSSGGTSTITASAKRTIYWESGDVTEETGNPTLSTNLGSLSSTASPSTLTLGENTSTSSRTATITASYSGKSATCTVTQAGAEPTIEYVFTISPWQVNVGASGGTGDIGFTSYKLVNGNQISLGYSIDSSTLPSWATYSNGRFTISSNSSTSSRSADVYFTQEESGKRDYATITQAGATPSTTYTFSINPYKVSVDSSGGSGSVTITSYKTVGSSTYDVDYSIDSSTLPSWASFNKSTSTFTIQSTTSTTGRTAKVYFDQDESGKRDYAELTQTGYTPPADNYVFTWEGGSTSDTSANFPWDFSANGTAANIPVISTKNGSSQSWSVSSKPSWITTSTTSSKVTISASDNSGSARSGKVVLTQSGSGKTLTVNVSQAAYSATVEWRYKFGFSNGVRDNISIAIRKMKEYDGASVTFASYKSKYVDGVEDVSSRQYVDFSIGDYASWATVTKVSSSIANEGKFKFTLSSNFNNKSNRQTSVTVTQNESNKSIICDIMQVGSDAFVATYYSHVRGSDTYPDEISFGLVTTPTTKQYEWESTFEVHTVDSDYDAYTYNYGAISEVKKVTANASMTTTWFGYEYIQNGGSYQYDLLKVNAPKSDGINHSEKLYILQLVTSAPSTSYNYREITNTPIAAEILVTQKGNTIS